MRRELLNSALTCFTKAIQLDNTNEHALYEKGRTLYLLEKDEEALECYNKLLTLNPNNKKARGEKWWIVSKMYPLEHTLQLLNNAVEENENDGEAWRFRGDILSELGREGEALESLNRAIEIDPNSQKAIIHKYILLHFSATFGIEEELEFLDGLLKRNKTNEDIWECKIQSLSRAGRIKEAMDCVNEALSYMENEKTLWEEKGILLEMLSRTEEALECYNRCIKMDRNWFRPWWRKGKILESLGRKTEALECVNQVIRIQKGGKRIYRDDLAWKGVLALDLGLFLEAVDAFDECLSVSEPTDYPDHDYPSEWVEKKVIEALRMLQKEMMEKAEECCEILDFSRKLFFVMEGVNIPPEMRWKIVSEGIRKKEARLSEEERKKTILYGIDETKLGAGEDAFWIYIGFAPSLFCLAKQASRNWDIFE